MSILHCYMARSDVVRPLLDTRQERLQEKSEQGLQKIKTRPKKKENKANKKLKQVTQKIKMRCQVEHPKMWICRTCRRVHRHTVALWQSSNFSEMRMQITKRWNPSSSFLHWWMLVRLQVWRERLILILTSDGWPRKEESSLHHSRLNSGQIQEISIYAIETLREFLVFLVFLVFSALNSQNSTQRQWICVSFSAQITLGA